MLSQAVPDVIDTSRLYPRYKIEEKNAYIIASKDSHLQRLRNLIFLFRTVLVKLSNTQVATLPRFTATAFSTPLLSVCRALSPLLSVRPCFQDDAF